MVKFFISFCFQLFASNQVNGRLRPGLAADSGLAAPGLEVAVVPVWIPAGSAAFQTNVVSLPLRRSAGFCGRARSFAGHGVSDVCLDVYKVMGNGVNSMQLEEKNKWFRNNYL